MPKPDGLPVLFHEGDLRPYRFPLLRCQPVQVQRNTQQRIPQVDGPGLRLAAGFTVSGGVAVIGGTV